MARHADPALSASAAAGAGASPPREAAGGCNEWGYPPAKYGGGS
eukprot:gene7221-6080_t